MFCKWAFAALMYFAFRSTPHKVHMALRTTVSQGICGKHNSIGGGGLLGKCLVTDSLWQQPLHPQMGITLFHVPGFLLSYMQISPWNHLLIMEIKPQHIICQPDSTTQVGSTFVFLVVTVSPGSLVPPVLFPGGKWVLGRGNGGFLHRLLISSRVVWRHISLQPRLSLHCEQAADVTAKNK